MPLLVNPNAGAGLPASELLQRYEGRRNCMVVAGGDGTVHRLINQGVTGAPIALIPTGTANDLAHGIGVPPDPSRAIARLEQAVASSMDLVAINDVKVATSAGLGLPFGIVSRAERWKRHPVLRFLGRWTYLVSTVRELGRFDLPVHRFRISHSNGVELFSGHSLLIMNQRRVASCLTLAPEARDDDGYFDVVLFPHRCGWRTLATLCGRRGLLHRRYRWARIEVDPPVPFMADGEVYPESSLFQVKILPGALKIMKAFSSTQLRRTP